MTRYTPTPVLRLPDGGLWSGDAEEAAALLEGDPAVTLVAHDIFAQHDGRVAAITLSAMDCELFSDGRPITPPLARRSQEFIARKAHQSIEMLTTKARVRHTPLEVEVRVGDASVSVMVPPNPFRNWREVRFTQQTRQKNYPLEWIRDHCLFYHRVHGFQRILFYDNMSDNPQELQELLEGLDRGLEVAFVRWPLAAWGDLPDGDGRYTYQQTSSLYAAYNHAYLLFRHTSRYMSHFDLDEYLHNAAGTDLERYVQRRTRFWPALTMFETQMANVPMVSDKGVLPRAIHFRHRNKLRRSFPMTKPIYRCRRSRVPNLFKPRIDMITLHQAAGFRVPAWRPMRRAARSPRAALGLLRELRTGRFRFWRTTMRYINLVDRDELTYYHYDGIYRPWRRDPDYRLPMQFDPKLHTPDDTMAEHLKRAGLGE